MKLYSRITVCLLVIVMLAQNSVPLYSAPKVRVKDVAIVEGVRSNHLFGYGLVMGLDGSGDSDSTEFTVQSIAAMLSKMGITVDQDDITTKNVAAVIVTAEIPAFAKSGTRLDVSVSAIGNAKSLFGGNLLMTPLQAVDGEIYALAQGPLSLGGYSFSSGGASAVKNIPTAAVIPNGALVEKEVPSTILQNRMIHISLRHPDFTSAKRLSDAVNAVFSDTATAKDAATVAVIVSNEFIVQERLVHFLSYIENLVIEPDTVARIVINERTGTIVAGSHVRISTVAVTHGSLNVVIKSKPVISQPNPFGEGTTVVEEDTEMVIEEKDNPLMVVEDGVTIGEVAQGLNALGASPRDLIAIFEAMKQAGALQAELVIM